MNPMTWNDLPGIDDISVLDGTDEGCLEAIKEVIQRHGKERRFGVTLLHQHFVLGEDELLLEHCDFESRTLTTRPERATEIIARGYRPTVWRFDGAQTHGCSYCPTHEDDKGHKRHDGHKESC